MPRPVQYSGVVPQQPPARPPVAAAYGQPPPGTPYLTNTGYPYQQQQQQQHAYPTTTFAFATFPDLIPSFPANDSSECSTRTRTIPVSILPACKSCVATWSVDNTPNRATERAERGSTTPPEFPAGKKKAPIRVE
ncbi:hypothetical protein BGZ83_002920 [Gryganskiella cystojenkinii]|nr:hypothetical protein BGZ83_002920 [Gryganskiella cystojenkinii]